MGENSKRGNKELKHMLNTTLDDVSGAVKDKFDDVIARMTLIGEQGKDNSEFEEKFTESGMRDEFNNIITKAGTQESTKVDAGEIAQRRAEGRMQGAVDRANRKAKIEVESQIRSIPVVGGVFSALERFTFLRGIMNIFSKSPTNDEDRY